MRRMLLLAIFLALAAPGVAQACSKDDATFYETFLDLSCLQAPLNNTTLDALGGLRLATNGAATTTAWDSDVDFNSGVSYQGTTFGPVGVRTLVASGTGAGATLQLPATLLPLALDAANPVLRPTTSTVGDNDNVDDPTVVKVGSTYVMWYSGTAEDGSGPAIFMATSPDGTSWTRANGGQAVLKGTSGTFDADGVYGADVTYDPTDVATPYRMYYSGRSGAFGGIGYATSVDGVTWLEYKSGGLIQAPVLDHGPPGSADSFSAADPSVIKDGSVWKMWYTGDDSNKKRIAYATSVDGIHWTKGGKVIAPEDAGVSANIAFGAFAPTVWKTTNGYAMLLTGRKLVSGSTFQTKIQATSSSDGITWSGPSPAVNPSGTSSNFDYSNLNSPEVLQDPGSAAPYKLYYSGNTVDANGNFHTRIGLATSSDGNNFNKVNGSQSGSSVLDVAAAGTAFDGRQVAGLSAVVPGGATPRFAGFYWGTRGSDFIPRLGEATSGDGSAWTKVPVTGTSGPGGSLFPDAVGNAFDKGGRRDPSALYDAGTYDLYYTGLSATGTRSIGFASTSQVGATKLPDNTSWSARSQVLAAGSGWDAGGVGHPSVIKDGSTYVLYYAGADSSGVAKIGRATSSAPGGPFTRDAANPLLTLGPAGSFDEQGVKDPVVVKLGATDYRMLYTGIDANGSERVGYATSADGDTWTKRGVVLNPSQIPYADDETAVEATGMLVDGSTLHAWTSGVDRTGRTVADHATTAYPTPASPAPGIPAGWATYQLGNSSTTVRDFRQIARSSSGSVSLWVSFLQPYSAAGNEFWSDYFPVTASATSQPLNFLLNVHGIRWQARLSGPAGVPAVDKVEVTHAPVSFASAGSATSNTITPSPGRMVTAWKSLTANTSLFAPNGGGSGQATVTVVDAGTNQPVASAPLNTSGDTVVDLSGIAASAHQALQVRLDLQSAGGQATPVVNSFKVIYVSAPAPPPPPPPVLTLLAAPKTIVFGKSLTLSGLLTQSGAPLSAQAVLLSGEPIGATKFTALPGATTSTTGSFSQSVKPTKRTTYKASFAGAPDVTVTVSVKHLVTISVARKGSKAYVRGKIGPAHPKRLVIVQIRKGRRWATFAKVKTTKRSTFMVIKSVDPRVHYTFRARTGADAQHLAGVSRSVRK